MEMVGQVPEEKFQIILTGDIASVRLPERLSILEAVSFKTTFQNVISLSPPPKKLFLILAKLYLLIVVALGL